MWSEHVLCCLQHKKGETPTSATNPFVADLTSPTSPSSAFDLLGAGSPVTTKPQTSMANDDLLSLAGPATNPFASMASAQPTATSPWASSAGRHFLYTFSLSMHFCICSYQLQGSDKMIIIIWHHALVLEDFDVVVKVVLFCNWY